MKVAILGALLLCIPFLARYFYSTAGRNRLAWFLVGVLPFVLPLSSYTDIAFISWPHWPGHTKGMELSFLDPIALALFLGKPRPDLRLPAYLKWSFYLYVVTIVISAFQAISPMPVGFYLWQVVRVTLFFYVVFAFAREEFQRQAIFEGLAVGLVLEAILCVWQRLVEHELQATGSFGHQNIFGMTVNLALIPLLGLFLSQRDGRSRLVFLGVASGLLCAALTVSRATVGLAALGTVAVLAVSTMKAYTVRKMRALLLLSFLAAILLPIITISFNTRFEKSSPSSTYDERGAFETAAVMIARAHPFGIGANNFVVIANAEGYYERAGVIPTHESRAAHVHNVYLLTAAENGWLALIAVCIVLVGSIVAGWKRLSKTGSAMDLHIALIVSVGLVSLHSLFEWVLVVASPQYALAIVLGLLVQSTQATYTASQSAVADSRLPRR